MFEQFYTRARVEQLAAKALSTSELGSLMLVAVTALTTSASEQSRSQQVIVAAQQGEPTGDDGNPHKIEQLRQPWPGSPMHPSSILVNTLFLLD